MWLRYLPTELKQQIRVMTYGYNAALDSKTDRVDSLDDLVKDFVSEIATARSGVCRTRLLCLKST